MSENFERNAAPFFWTDYEGLYELSFQQAHQMGLYPGMAWRKALPLLRTTNEPIIGPYKLAKWIEQADYFPAMLVQGFDRRLFTASMPLQLHTLFSRSTTIPRKEPPTVKFRRHCAEEDLVHD